MTNYNTVVVAETRSLIDREEIVILATGFHYCTNPKLGFNVIQTFYLKKNVHPYEAQKNGTDYSVCGNCPLRRVNQNICYVNPIMLGNMWKAYRNERYGLLQSFHLEQIKAQRKTLRLGAYGEPTSVPLELVGDLIAASSIAIGYTHNWRSPLGEPYKPYLMASVESKEQAQLAQSLGWNYYRIMNKTEEPQEDEILCPWYVDKTQCQDCKRCQPKSRTNIVTYPTTYKAKRFAELSA